MARVPGSAEGAAPAHSTISISPAASSTACTRNARSRWRSEERGVSPAAARMDRGLHHRPSRPASRRRLTRIGALLCALLGRTRMSTKLEKPIRREIEIDGERFTLVVAPDGLRLTKKRYRSGLAV